MTHATRRHRRATHAALAGLLLVAVTAACSSDHSLSAAELFAYGPSQALGQGTARTYVELDASGVPAEIGVALSERALIALPQTPLPGGPSAVNLTLQLPAAAKATGFDHVMLDWNPGGHEPEHVYTLPHFDFHFFLTSPAERDAIMPNDPAWAARAASFPSAEFIPTDYAAASTLGGVPPAAAAVPMMGMHWINVKSPEVQPPPNNKPFTSTFIYGSWDGKINFVEPMITKAYIESTKDLANGVSLPINVLPRAQKPGLYPTKYSIRYDKPTGEYRIAIEGLVAKN
jgi:uncharacterized protein